MDMLPPIVSRVDAQDAVYDGYARIRTAFANFDIQGAVTAAGTIPPTTCDVAAPADAISEVADVDRQLASRDEASYPDSGEGPYTASPCQPRHSSGGKRPDSC